MKIKINGHFNLTSVDEMLKKRGLNQRGFVQKAVDSEVIRRNDPYVPFRTGTLKGSALIASRIGDGVVIYNTPYARRQYYENAGNGKEGMSNGGRRGAKWFERMKAEQGQQIIDMAIKLAGGKK